MLMVCVLFFWQNSKAMFEDSDLEALIQSHEGNLRVSQPLHAHSPLKEELWQTLGHNVLSSASPAWARLVCMFTKVTISEGLLQSV